MGKGRVLPWIAIVLSAAALLMSILNIDRFDVDPQSLIGWSIAILALLVTILIGWQIYNVVGLNGMIHRKAERFLEKSKNEIEDEMYSIYIHHLIDMLKMTDPGNRRFFNSLLFRALEILPQTPVVMQQHFVNEFKAISKENQIRIFEGQVGRFVSRLAGLSKDVDIAEIVDILTSPKDCSDNDMAGERAGAK